MPAAEWAKVYGIYDEDAGVETRGRFIIDPDGIIQGYEVLTPPVGRNVSESLRQIQAFQLVRESKGTEATPSGWKPGKMTLKTRGPTWWAMFGKNGKPKWPLTNPDKIPSGVRRQHYQTRPHPPLHINVVIPIA